MRRTTQQNGVTTPPGVRCKEGAAPANSIKTVRYWSAGDFQPHQTNGQVTPKKRNRDAFAVADVTKNRMPRRHCFHREGAEVLQKSTMPKTVSEGHYLVKRGNMRFRAVFLCKTPRAARAARGYRPKKRRALFPHTRQTSSGSCPRASATARAVNTVNAGSLRLPRQGRGAR